MRIRIYPHNDLFNLAHYHRDVIEQKVRDGIEDAIALDCMSCLIALAFTVESLMNFVGAKVVPDWKERRPYGEKMAVLEKRLGFKLDENVDPYKALAKLKSIRDRMAHGKPIETTRAVSSRAALRRAMAAPWDEFLTPEFVAYAYEQAKSFEHMLFEKAGIPLGATVTSAAGALSDSSEG